MHLISKRRGLRTVEILTLLVALVGFTAVHRNTRIFSFQNPTRCHSISNENSGRDGLIDDSNLVESAVAATTHPLAPTPAVFDTLTHVACSAMVVPLASPQPLPRPPSVS